MKNTGTLHVTTPSDREIVLTRVFDAPRHLVFDAFTKPELLRQWLLGPPGWSMVVCELAQKVGDRYRYVWRHESGNEMGMGGVYREIVLQERLVCTELFDEAWYAGESLITTTLVEQGGRTTMTSTMRYVSQEVRDGVLEAIRFALHRARLSGWPAGNRTRVVVAGPERFAAEDREVHRDRGRDALDAERRQRGEHLGDRVVAIAAVDDHLGEQRVVERRHDIAALDVSVDAHVRSA